MSLATKQAIEACVVLLVVAIGGCRPEQVTVEDLGAAFVIEGTVTLDGRPLSAGTIKLVPTDKDWQLLDDLPADDGTIENGRFKMNASLGYKLVEILGDDSVTIPARYNAQTELKAYVHHATEDVFHFPLKSK